MLMKEPKTPCSFSRCSHNMLLRGTNRMWKSRAECSLSSLWVTHQRSENCVGTSKPNRDTRSTEQFLQTWTHSQQWCPWAPAGAEQRRWHFWHQQAEPCHFWGWTFSPLHVPWRGTKTRLLGCTCLSTCLNVCRGQKCIIKPFLMLPVRSCVQSLALRREYWAISPKGPVRYSSQTMAWRPGGKMQQQERHTHTVLSQQLYVLNTF